MKQALKHAEACHAMAEQGAYHALLQYCRRHGVELPPHAPPVTAHERRDLLARLAVRVGDHGWWYKRLKLHASRARRRALDGGHAGA